MRGDHKINILNHYCNNYYSAFNISRKRASELIMLCKEITSVGGTQTEHMAILSEYAESKEEIVFIMFKLGEIRGMMEAVHNPIEAMMFVAELISKHNDKG